MGRLVSVKEVANELGLSRWSTYRLIREGRLPGVVRAGQRRVFVRRDVLDAWLRGGIDAWQKDGPKSEG
jgi:excisionase family DNA binding protein